MPHAFVVALAFGASIVLSGAIHLDGFLDSCDALAACVAPERRLEIMKDPRHGTFALAGFAVLCAVWISALASIPVHLLPWALAFSAGVSRAAAVLNAYRLPYDRAGASARAFAERPNPWILVIGAIAATGCAWIAPVWMTFVPFAFVLALALGNIAAPRLGGVLVGDVYGAIVVALDVLLLSGIALVR